MAKATFIGLLIFGVFLAIVHLSQANLIEDEVNFAKDILNVYAKQRSLLLCMANSCDPLAVHKIFQFGNDFEDSITHKVPFIETKEFKAMKLLQSAKTSLSSILALEPECRNPSYTCPHPVFQTVPKYVYDYVDALQEMLEASKCVTSNHMQTFMDIIDKCVDYIEAYRQHMDNYLEKMVAVPLFVAKEYRKLCYQL